MVVLFANHPHVSHWMGPCASEIRGSSLRFGFGFEHRLLRLSAMVFGCNARKEDHRCCRYCAEHNRNLSQADSVVVHTLPDQVQPARSALQSTTTA